MNFNRVHLNLGGGKLYQFSNKNRVQMMSYLIEAPTGELIMIDGGNPCDEDADFLESVLLEKGGHISAWFITHAHDDHFGALLRLMERGKLNFTVDCLYFDFPTLDWIAKTESNSTRSVSDFTEQVKKHGLKVLPIGKGDCIEAGIKIEALNSLGDYESYPSINDTSIVLLAHFPKRSVLFLADLAEAGQKALINESGNKLRCDIVQMAHHGQRGVNFEMYSLIAPKICLYTAPDWLWDNDNGGGFDSGPWLTVKTREWMERLGAQASFPAAFSDYEFD